MWTQWNEIPKGRSRSVPADCWHHDDGRIIRREAVWEGDPPTQWVLVTPLTHDEAMAMVNPQEPDPFPETYTGAPIL